MQARLAEQMEARPGTLGERNIFLHGVEVGKTVHEGSSRWKVYELLDGAYVDLCHDLMSEAEDEDAADLHAIGELAEHLAQRSR